MTFSLALARKQAVAALEKLVLEKVRIDDSPTPSGFDCLVDKVLRQVPKEPLPDRPPGAAPFLGLGFGVDLRPATAPITPPPISTYSAAPNVGRDVASIAGRRWAIAQPLSERKSMTAQAVTKILIRREDYLAVERSTGVPWWFVAGIHYRESDLDFSTYLGNGQKLKRTTTIVPKNRGPFSSWHAGAIDALTIEKYVGMKWPSIEVALIRAELYNGAGYRKRGLPSPYVWAGTSIQQPGLFVADGKFDKNKLDPRIGVAPIWKALKVALP